MTEEKRPLKVFLCHASADKPAVSDLYMRLKEDKVDVWFDKESLLPGQDWEYEIRKIVREADVVVVCLSKKFNQEGFRQKEVRLALETAMMQPEGDIFIIPARLEECENLESLTKWHWVNLFERNGYQKLLVSLNSRAKTLGTRSFSQEDEKYSHAPQIAVIDIFNEDAQGIYSETFASKSPRDQKSPKSFVYGRAVHPEEFFGREADLLTIFNRLRMGESTAIVGERRIGKTSLLLKILDQTTQEYFLKEDARRIIYSFIDLQAIDFEYSPANFWNEALAPFQNTSGNTAIIPRLNQVRDDNYSNSSLRKLFTYIANQDQLLALLLDEYDRLFSHSKFMTPSFFAGLRSLSTITGGLAIITASRLTVAQMNMRGKEMLGEAVDTSPFFNNFIEVRLRPLDNIAVEQLLQSIPNKFTAQDKLFIRRIAGNYPFLLQALAATLVEINSLGEERQVYAAEIFYERVGFYFDILWHEMDDRARITSIVLSLIELDMRSGKNSISTDSVDELDSFYIELSSLVEFGLVERVNERQRISDSYGLFFRGDQWTISAQAFAWWARDMVITRSRRLKDFDDWINDKRYKVLLTEEQWAKLVGSIKLSPEFLTRDVRFLATSVIKEFEIAKRSNLRAGNPYIAGSPLRDPEGFYGRRDIIDWVSAELSNIHTNALVLYGQRRVGKTTILLQLRHSLPSDKFLPIYFDLQDQAKLRLGEVLANLADSVGSRVNLSEHKPESFDDEGKYFRSVFLPDLYEVLDKGSRPVFLLDEFDVLDQGDEGSLENDVASRTLFPFLRQVMDDDIRPAFVFVVGRRTEDLRVDFNQMFKTSLTKEVWVLDRLSAETLVRQAEVNGTLTFTQQSIDRILQLTKSHAYLTQLVCQRLWQRAYAGKPAGTPTINVDDVTASIPDALELGDQALIWLWNGLGPAEKIYAAVLAEISDEGKAISEDQVIKVLAEHAARARLRRREVELAPQDLITRHVLELTKNREYIFAIELFRRWVKQKRSLKDVVDEIDKVDPLAQQLFELGQVYYKKHEWSDAVRFFNDTLRQNPSHFRANLLLGETFLAMGQTEDAVRQLETAYSLDSYESQYPLARVLIALAKEKENDGLDQEALVACERALEVSPNERLALDIKKSILKRFGKP